MKIFVVNAGSSSLKYQLIDMENEQVLAKGLCERIGVSGAISHKAADGRTYSAETPMPTHSEAFEAVVYALTKSEAKVINSFDEISAIGHRIVQGGSIFPESCLVRRSPCSTPPSTRQCPQRLICIPYPINITRNTAFADTALTAPPTAL